MSYIIENFETYLATTAELLLAEGMKDAASVLRGSAPKVEETGYDNWNGGTTVWTIYLRMEPSRFAQLGASREALEEQISNRLKLVLEQFTEDWFSVKIVPEVTPKPEWRQAHDDISRVTRQNIFDGLRIDNVVWSGRLEEVEFFAAPLRPSIPSFI